MNIFIDDGSAGGGSGSTTTWNPADKTSGMTLSNGNLTMSKTSGASEAVRSTTGKSSGKWYWEIENGIAANNSFGIRIAGDAIGSSPNAGTTISLRENGSFLSSGITVAGTPGDFDDSDVVMVALDLDNARIWLGVNGVWPGSGNPATGANPSGTGIPAGTYHAYAWTDNAETPVDATLNCGAVSFNYTVPSGFTAL